MMSYVFFSDFFFWRDASKRDSQKKLKRANEDSQKKLKRTKNLQSSQIDKHKPWEASKKLEGPMFLFFWPGASKRDSQKKLKRTRSLGSFNQIDNISLLKSF